jgi:hypothetical protein
MTPAADPEVIQLAADALAAAMGGDQEAAVAALHKLDAEGVYTAMTAWCDTLAIRRGVSRVPGRVLRPAWRDTETGLVITDADAVDPVMRWAGRFMAARAVMDHDTVQALAGSLPCDAQITGEHVLMVLQMVADSLNQMMAPDAGGLN